MQAIKGVKRDKLDTNGELVIYPALDALIFCSFHSAENSDGGCVIFTTPYYPDIIKKSFHNNGTCEITGTCVSGIVLKTNMAAGSYRLIEFKNYNK